MDEIMVLEISRDLYRDARKCTQWQTSTQIEVNLQSQYLSFSYLVALRDTKQLPSELWKLREWQIEYTLVFLDIQRTERDSLPIDTQGLQEQQSWHKEQPKLRHVQIVPSPERDSQWTWLVTRMAKIPWLSKSSFCLSMLHTASNFWLHMLVEFSYSIRDRNSWRKQNDSHGRRSNSKWSNVCLWSDTFVRC